MKKIIFLLSILGILFLLNSCSAGYVTEEPVYQTYNRPERPSVDYIWIDGGWNWNSRTNSYTQRNGSWERQNHKHKEGHWEKNQHGSKWVNGSRR